MRALLDGTLPPVPFPAGLSVRAVGDADTEALGELMLRAYEGTLDDQGLVLEDHVDVAARTMAGQFGPLRPDASFVATPAGSGVLAGATIVTTWRELPLLAFALVRPSWQNRGVGTALLTRSGQALRAAGDREWTLAVTRHNPAVRLYRRLGFHEDQSLIRRSPT